MDLENRIVVLIDMDCFYCQVEEKLNPELKGKPIAVVQYNPWQGGGIIAVNYAARALGVTRHMRGNEAKEKCPEIQLPSVPCQRGKADITKYRDAGKEVAQVLQKFTPLLERASIDEAYLDITGPVQQRLKSLSVNTITPDMMPNTYALGYDKVEEFLADVCTGGGDCIDLDFNHTSWLVCGAVIVSEIRAAVYEETGYRCSAGIANNKILAKLVCGMNKPNKQTILPKHCIDILYKTLPINKVKHLGGKFGHVISETLKISTMAELQNFSLKELQSRFDEKNGTWLYNIAHGIDMEPVQARFNPKSIGCCKQFRGRSALLNLETLKKWLKDLGDEIEDRLEKDALENNRTPKQMVVSFSTHLENKKDVSSSRSYNFVTDDELCGELFSNKALELILENTEGTKPKENENDRKLVLPITFLGISVGKFEDNTDSKKTKKIVDYFSVGTSKDIGKCADNMKRGEQKLRENISPDNENIGKGYILQKFFKLSDKGEEKAEKSNIMDHASQTVFESSLLKQESFFAKMLNRNNNENNVSDSPICHVDDAKAKPITPVCNIIRCEENSNDTDYSGSTINDEINKSIALFDEDPQEVTRMSNIRQLLNSKAENNYGLENQLNENIIETSKCSQCGKVITLDKSQMHSDYHLAIKLREEERELSRTERQKIADTTKDDKSKRNQSKENMNKGNIASITNFFVKLDENIVTKTCTECGMKVPSEQFTEHLDFHIAQKLNRELNKKAITPATANSIKRKRKDISSLNKLKVPCKSIETFFK